MTKEQRVRKSSADPCLFVVFGATGDLMRRKLLPALHRLDQAKVLPDAWRILGVSRSADMDDARYRDWVRDALAEAKLAAGDEAASWARAHTDYQPIGAGESGDFTALE